MKPSPDGAARQDAGPALATARALAAGLRLQAVVALAVTLLMLAIGPVASYSALCGGLAVYVPALIFTALVGRRIGGDSAAFLRIAVPAEFGKLVLTGALCAAVFVWVRPLAPAAFFAGMVTVLVAGWVGLGRAMR